MPACAARAGIHAATLYRWLKDNEKFALAFALARNEGRARLEERALATADRDDGRHAIELLSRRYPSAWGRSDRVKLDAKVSDVTGTEDRATRLARLKSVVAALESAEEKDGG